MSDFAAVRRLLGGTDSLTVLTGAGVSAESGIPTFRGSQGLWRQFRAEDLATPRAFGRNPRLVWEWYDWRRGLIADAAPNGAHMALVALEGTIPSFSLITQNVDGLHDRAGSRNILKVHGDIWWVRCSTCGVRKVDLRTPLPVLPPLCTDCGGVLRPDVVWFGESLPADVWDAAERAARQARIFLVAGTSAQVYPAAGLARIAKSAGATVIEVNPEESGVSSLANYVLRGPAGQILPQLVPQPALPEDQ
ncbi:MAG TPA: NAD-dependent deacylase [Bryobacteraceae bacterium]